MRLLRFYSRDKPIVERVTCLKLTTEHAERAGALCARRRIDASSEKREERHDANGQEESPNGEGWFGSTQ